MTEEVRSEKLGEVADEFDAIHTIQRALARRLGRPDHPGRQLRPYVIDALERGMARAAGSDAEALDGGALVQGMSG